MTDPPAGHRTPPHTADIQVETWGPTPEECLRQAVLGSVEMFLDTAAGTWSREGSEQMPMWTVSRTPTRP